MNADRLLPLLVCCCCIAALGVSATTLEDSMATDPDDVIDVRYDSVPLGKEQLGAIKQQLTKPGKPDTPTDPETSDAQQTGQPSGESTETQQNHGGDTPSVAMGHGIPSLVDQLLGLLRDLLVAAAMLVGLALTAGMVYRYRERIAAVLNGLLPNQRDSGDVAWTRDETADYQTAASNAVHRAWLRMLETAGIENPDAHSPRENARRAIDHGLGRDPVERITREFEAVRYGDADPTSDRVERVEKALDRLEDTGSTPGPDDTVPAPGEQRAATADGGVVE